MIADSLPQEAMQRANSPEGMEQLVHALLFNIENTINCTSMEQLLFERIKEYVLLKRINGIHRSMHIRHHPFDMPYVDSDQIYAARDRYKELESGLIRATSCERVQFLKRYWGKLLTFQQLKQSPDFRAMYKHIFENVAHGH